MLSRFLKLLVGCTLAMSGFAGGGLENCDWTWVNPLPQGDRVRQVVWGDGEFLGLAESGLVQTSIDGQSWEVVASLEEPDGFSDLIWDGSQYLAISAGVIGATPRLYRSTDGLQWTSAPIGFGFTNSLATDGSRVVIVGNNSNILFTDDLTTFTRTTFSGSWVAVVWTGTQFVAIRDEDEALTSPDGQTWTLHQTGVTGKYSSMVMVGNRLVAAGFQGAVMTSTDGVNWEAGVSGVNSQSTVFEDGSQFILTGPANPLVSTNGVDWTATSGTLGFVLSLAYNGTSYVAFNTIGRPSFAASLDSWTDTTDAFTSSKLNAVATDGQAIVAAGESGTVVTSTDGMTWNASRVLGNATISDIKWDGAQFFAIGSVGTFATSSDGNNWDAIITPDSLPLLGVDSDGVGYVAVGNQGALISSDDGVTWTVRDSGTTEQLNAVAWSGTEFVAVGRRGTVLRSTDKIDWTLIDAGTSQELNDILFAGNQYVAIGRGGVALTSADGLEWEVQSTGVGRALTDLHWSFGRYVGSGEATIVVSTDGIDWTEDQTFSTVATQAALELPDAAVAVGRYGSIQYGTCSLFQDGFD